MIEKIEILQHCEGCHLGFHSGKETAWLLGIVAYHHEVVIQLRKDGLDSLPEAFVGPCRWSPVLLVQPIWDIKGNVSGFKQIQLNWSTQVTLVSQDHTVAVLPLYIFEILQIMYIGSGHGKAARVCPPRASDDDPYGQKYTDPLRQNKNTAVR